MLFFKISFFYLLLREKKGKNISCKIIELAHNCDFYLSSFISIEGALSSFLTF